MARHSTLKGDFRYTSDTVFDTFAWPQFVGRVPDAAPSSSKKSPREGTRPTGDAIARIRSVAEAARALRGLRRKIMAANGWSLRALYRTLETPGDNALRDAHAALDAAVRRAYGMAEGEDILAFLLKLNLELAAKEAKGEPITPPGLPAWVKDAKEFITGDCVTV